MNSLETEEEEEEEEEEEKKKKKKSDYFILTHNVLIRAIYCCSFITCFSFSVIAVCYLFLVL